MKTIVKTTLLIFSTFLVACAQQQSVPAKANKAFEAKFTNATDVSWGKENKEEWEAEFKMNGKQYSANFKENGDWVETESEIEKTEVPMNISEAMLREYPDAKIKDVFKVERQDQTLYEFEYEQNGQTSEAVFDNSGTIQNKKSTEKDEVEDDDND